MHTCQEETGRPLPAKAAGSLPPGLTAGHPALGAAGECGIGESSCPQTFISCPPPPQSSAALPGSSDSWSQAWDDPGCRLGVRLAILVRKGARGGQGMPSLALEAGAHFLWGAREKVQSQNEKKTHWPLISLSPPPSLPPFFFPPELSVPLAHGLHLSITFTCAPRLPLSHCLSVCLLRVHTQAIIKSSSLSGPWASSGASASDSGVGVEAQCRGPGPGGTAL